MINLHTHSLFSDGILLPSELVSQAKEKGYQIIAITDHADSSNLDFIIPRIAKVSQELSLYFEVEVIPGIEITHAPPLLIPNLVKESRNLGAKIVLVHGETICEPVTKGTNWAALNCDIDILAHPGLITEEEVKLARKNKIALEITTRLNHATCNGYLANLARKIGARLVINSDAHTDQDMLGYTRTCQIAKGAGLSEEEIKEAFNNGQEIAKKIREKERR
ncbi:histidinol phosphate phosphatase domain-containing protein [bacterium]|nr:histidinol phosphate phosphatase domain-containing protein [bacterium]MBU0899442.1 histidinol phosphate phosphatase domain-containing protein [bacterium]MBU1153422.1 histidinol phosphate phosphatase domain-containing protein [bacterium]MBU2599252.1 histidinol phosphate phosphatase domain-containing protein [bacterium]